MVSSTGIVTHKVIEVEERLSPSDLSACANYLNVHFAGMTLAEIRTRLLELMQRGEGPLRHPAAERGRPRRAGLLRLGERGQRLPRRHLEHPRAARVRRRRAHARALPHLRGEEPAGPDPQRLHRRRRDPGADRPREPRPRAAGPVAGRPRAAASRASPGSAWASWARRAWSTRTSSPWWTTWRAPCPRSCRGTALEHEGQRQRRGPPGRGRAPRPGRRRTPRPARRGPARRPGSPRASPTTRSRPCARSATELKDALLRRRAEFENYRRRVERDRGSAAAEAEAGILRPLLDTVDNLERALAAGGARLRPARGRRADAARAAGPARLAGRHDARPARASGSTRASTRRSCTSRRPASRRGRWRRSTGRATSTRTGCSGPRSSRSRAPGRRSAGGGGRAVTARREKERGSQWER